jgi:hypothetical protein
MRARDEPKPLSRWQFITQELGCRKEDFSKISPLRPYGSGGKMRAGGELKQVTREHLWPFLAREAGDKGL